MKTEEQIRKLADEGTQGRLRVRDRNYFNIPKLDPYSYGPYYICHSGTKSDDTAFAAVSDYGPKDLVYSNALRIALMADADMMRALADVVEAARATVRRRSKHGPDAEGQYYQLLQDALARLDALTEKKNDE